MAAEEQQEQQASTFDLLARQLNPRERDEMLRRIEESVTDSPEPLKQPEAEEAIDLDEVFESFGLLRRLVIWLRMMIGGLDRNEAIERTLLKDLAHRVNQHDPDLIDFRHRQLRTRFAQFLRELQEHARVLNPLLSRILGREKQAFVVFYAAMEIEEHHHRLLEDTNPNNEYTIEDEVAERDIRGKLNGKLEGTLQSIPKIMRQQIASSLKLLELLFRLSSFPFDRMLNQFQEFPDGTCLCGFDMIAEEVERLASIMAGLTEYPGMRVIEAAILFAYQGEHDTGEDSEEQMRRHLHKALRAADGIRSFNRSVPLGDIVRLIRGKRTYVIKPEGGGEEWYQLYLHFWRSRLDRLVARFIARRKLQTIVREAAELLEAPRIEPPPYYPKRETGEPALYGLAFAFTRHFYTKLFPGRMEGPIRTVHIDGEFYKQSNREQYNSIYNELLRLRERSELLASRLAPGGSIHEHLSKLQEEEENPSVRRSKTNEQLRRIEEDAYSIVDGTITNLGILENLLNGILNARAGSAYDTLANRSQIGGSQNGRLLEDLQRCVDLSQEVRRVAVEILSIEKTTRGSESEE
ncbi:MAG: DUF5312 family protein [Spirochaetaceae bacterium]